MYVHGKRKVIARQIAHQPSDTHNEQTQVIETFDVHPPIGKQPLQAARKSVLNLHFRTPRIEIFYFIGVLNVNGVETCFHLNVSFPCFPTTKAGILPDKS